MQENQNTNEQGQPKAIIPVEAQSPQSSAEMSIPASSDMKEETPAFATQPQTTNHQLQTAQMEVHKHPHHVMHKKKWNEYLLEFFMLFLAVFLGFIAENVREHIVEKQRGKQYIESFYEDLKNDTSRINTLMAYDQEKVNALLTMYDCYDTVSTNTLSTDCMEPLVKYSRSNKGFVLTQRTLQQLANAGGYRLLNKQDADSIAAYENAYRGYLDFQGTVFQSAQDNVRNTLNRISSFKFIAPFQVTAASFSNDSLNVKAKGPLLIIHDRLLINQWFNELSLYLRTINGQLTILSQLKTRATGLLKYYNSRYRFEN